MLSFKTLSKCWNSFPNKLICNVRNGRLQNRALQASYVIQNIDLPFCTSIHKTPNNYLSSSHDNLHIFIRPTGIRHFKTAVCLYAEVTTVEVPPFAESVTEGDLRWVKGVGDQVAEDETVAEVETDKTTVPVNAPFSGVIVELLIEDGTTVAPGTKIFKIQPGDAPAQAKSEPEKKEAAAPEQPPPPPATAAATAAPAAQPSAPIPSSPPPRVDPPKAPMQSIPVAAIKHSSFIHQAEVRVPPADYSKEISGTRTEQRVKMSRMRLRIAQRLKEAQNTNAMLTTFNEVDMGNIMEMRKSVGDAFVKT